MGDKWSAKGPLWYHWFPGFRHPPGETPTGTMVFSGENPLKLGTSMVICWGKKYKYTSLSGTKRKLLAQENQKNAIHGLTAISEPQNCAITLWWGDHLHQGRAKQGAVPRLFGPAKFFLIFKDPIFTRVYWITYIVKTVFFRIPIPFIMFTRVYIVEYRKKDYGFINRHHRFTVGTTKMWVPRHDPSPTNARVVMLI